MSGLVMLAAITVAGLIVVAVEIHHARADRRPHRDGLDLSWQNFQRVMTDRPALPVQRKESEHR